MRGHTALRDQDTPSQQQGGAGTIQGRIQGGEVRVLLGYHAAGLVLRRFAMSSANPNITSENRISVAMEEGSANEVSTPG